MDRLAIEFICVFGMPPVDFVKLAADLYEARFVRLGASLNERVAVTEGLGAGEPVVVEGSYMAKSQLLISKLGAGCVD